MTVSSEPASLRKDVGLLGVVTLGAGTAIGVSIFSILQPTAQIAGSGLLLAIVIAALPMLLFAVSYSYLGSIFPVSGASYEWPSRFLHPMVGFLIAWMRIIANVGAITILSQVLVSYLAMIIPLPLKPTMAALITVIFLINYLGVGVAARAQSLLMALLLIVLAIFVVTGLPSVELERIGNPLEHGLLPVLAAVPLMISLFLGIESAVEIGEEVRNPQRNIPLGIAIACLLAALVYGAVSFTALGLAGPVALGASDAPLLTAAELSIGKSAVPLIVGAAAFSIFKSINAAALVFSRSLFAMGRNGVLPRALGVVNPSRGTPDRALLVGYGCAMAGLLLPSSLIFLLLAVNIPTMLKYLACSLSAARVAKAHPDLHAMSKLRISGPQIIAISLAGALCAAAILLFGIEADVRPYLLVGGWLLLGIIYWFARRLQQRNAAG